MGDGGELECALDDAFGIKITVRPHCEKLICENTLQKTLNSPTVVKVFQNKLARLEKNLPTSFCVCLVLLKQHKLEIQAEFRSAFKIFW